MELQFHRAVRCNQADLIVKLFLKFHENPDLCLSSGNSPLTRCCYLDHWKTVQTLLGLGANVNKADGSGATPFHTAAQGGSVDCLDQIVYNVDRSRRDYKRRLELNTNVYKGRGEVIALNLPLNHFRRDVNVATLHNNWTALHLAAGSVWSRKGNHTDAIAYLLNLGAEVDPRDVDGETPLHHAAWISKAKCVFHLLYNGANIDAVNNEGMRPLDVAREDGEEATIRLLEFGKKRKFFRLQQRHKRLKQELSKLPKLNRYIRRLQIWQIEKRIAKINLMDIFCGNDYLLEYFTTNFFRKLKAETEDLAFVSRLRENEELVGQMFDDDIHEYIK